MNRKIAIIGGILIVAAVVLIFGALPSISPPFSYLNTTLQSGRFASLNFTITNQTEFFALQASFPTPINVYIFNSMDFGPWEGSVLASNYSDGYVEAVGMEGKGTLAIFTNTTSFSYAGGLIGNVLYTAPNATYRNTTNFTFVFQNQNGASISSSLARGIVAYVPPQTLSTIVSNRRFTDYIYLTGGISLASIIIVIIGIVLIVYAFIKKPKVAAVMAPKGSEDLIKQRDELYKSVDEKPSKGKKSKKKDDSKDGDSSS